MDPIFWSIVLLVFGFIFLVLEALLPTGGVLGIIAGLSLVAAITLAFFHGYYTGAVFLLIVAFAIPLYFAALVKIWPHTPIGRRVLLRDLKTEDVMPNDERYTQLASLVGKLGVARSEMMLSGQISVDGEKYDAISESFAIEPGTPIKVVSVKGTRIYVQPHGSDESDSGDQPVRDRDVLSTPIEELGIDLDEV